MPDPEYIRLRLLVRNTPEKFRNLWETTIRTSLEPRFPGSQEKAPNHWATLPPKSHVRLIYVLATGLKNIINWKPTLCSVTETSAAALFLLIIAQREVTSGRRNTRSTLGTIVAARALGTVKSGGSSGTLSCTYIEHLIKNEIRVRSMWEGLHNSD